jgi:uridine kinase
MTRTELLKNLSHLIQQIKKPHPTRVAIDGVDTAGKTMLANALGEELNKTGRSVIRSSIDGFHRPKVQRYKRGQLSPEGYYYDSFDYESIEDRLLKPLGPEGNLLYTSAVFNFRTDSLRSEPVKLASANTILIFDGVFLLRPELNEHWDFRIFLHVDFVTALERAILRDRALFEADEITTERYTKRYFPGQQIYLKQVRPTEIADIVIDNRDPSHPMIIQKTS